MNTTPMNAWRGSQPGTLSRKELTALGLEHLAYVRKVLREGEALWSIHSADGVEIGEAPSRDLAFAAIVQHDMEPASVH